jgi:2-oxoglutarate ferredoxin oxidoreductase subunit beta
MASTPNTQPLTTAELNTSETCTWCPGCGDFAIWTALKHAAREQGWNNTNTALVAGIGCHGHLVNFLKLTSFEGLHGRAIPVASGLKMANHDLNVFVITGDGDCLSEGGNHLIHAARRNHDLTVLLHDNALYALTTGQTSPRSPKGYKSKSTPHGSLAEPIQPLHLALAAGATFLARCYAGNILQLTDLIAQANAHRGFAVLQVLQPCVTFNHVYTHQFYQENVYQLDATYDHTNRALALQKTLEWDFKKIPVGILYQEERATYEEQLPQLSKTTLVKQNNSARNLTPTFTHYS